MCRADDACDRQYRKAVIIRLHKMSYANESLSMRCKSGLLIILLAAVIVCPSAAAAAIAPFDTNLIVTGNTEADVRALTDATISPVANVDRSEVTGLSFAIAAGIAFPGARSIEVARAVTHLAGSYHEGYDDTLSLKLMAVPLPSAIVLFGGGLSILPWVLWSQRQAKRA